MFLDYANNTLLNGETFDQSYINNQMFTELEQPFTVDQTEFPTEPTGKKTTNKFIKSANVKIFQETLYKLHVIYMINGVQYSSPHVRIIKNNTTM
jgi:hypothetical protein